MPPPCPLVASSPARPHPNVLLLRAFLSSLPRMFWDRYGRCYARTDGFGIVMDVFMPLRMILWSLRTFLCQIIPGRHNTVPGRHKLVPGRHKIVPGRQEEEKEEAGGGGGCLPPGRIFTSSATPERSPPSCVSFFSSMYI